MRRRSSPSEGGRRPHPAALLGLLAALAAAGLGPPPAGAVQGVSPTEIVIGVTSAFKGHAASLGAELYRGYKAYFDKVNEEGGVNGRRLRLVLYDDGYDPPRAVQNTIRLVERDRVFLLFGNVGTPTTVQVLPLLKKYEDRSIHLFSPFTGAQPHREEPYATFVFNVRASYRQETQGLVDLLTGGGYRKIGVLYQSDSYGKSGEDGITRALKGHGLSIVAEATYARGSRFDAPFARQVDILKKAGAQAIICIGAYEACAGFIRDARDAGFKGPIANISFVGPDAMLELLREHGRKTGRDYSLGLINSHVVPFWGRNDLKATQEYRELIQRYDPKLPRELQDEQYRPARYSSGGMEGYLNARVLTEALRRMGGDFSPGRFREVMESMTGYDAGLDAPVVFGPGDHQGLEKVYYTTVLDGEWAPLPDLSAVRPPR